MRMRWGKSFLPPPLYSGSTPAGATFQLGRRTATLRWDPSGASTLSVSVPGVDPGFVLCSVGPVCSTDLPLIAKAVHVLLLVDAVCSNLLSFRSKLHHGSTFLAAESCDRGPRGPTPKWNRRSILLQYFSSSYKGNQLPSRAVQGWIINLFFFFWLVYHDQVTVTEPAPLCRLHPNHVPHLTRRSTNRCMETPDWWIITKITKNSRDVLRTSGRVNSVWNQKQTLSSRVYIGFWGALMQISLNWLYSANQNKPGFSTNTVMHIWNIRQMNAI